MGSYAQALQNSQQWAQMQRQQAIQQNQAASLGIAHVLTSGIHPDTGEALTPQEKIQLAQRNKELQGQLQDLWNPRQSVNQVGHNLAAASGVPMPETPLHKVGDFLHLTQPPAQPSNTMINTNAPGLVQPGNLPIWNRPTVQNADGSHSTELSFSREDNGKEVLVPSIVNGKFLTPDGKMPPMGNDSTGKYVPTPQEQAMYDQAWQHYQNTGEHLGKFSNPKHADAYAGALHNRGDQQPNFKSPQQQMQDLRDITQKYQPLPGQQEAEAASFALKSHLRDIDNMPDLTDEQKQEASAHALGLPFSGSFKPPVTLTLGDGRTMSAQQSAKDGRWYDLNRQLIPSDSLAGAVAQGKETSDTRLRADFAADQNKLPGEAFLDWKHRKNSAPGYTFQPKTGMVTEKATGKQYSPGDPNNPPEVAAVFKGAADMTAHTEAFQTRLAAIKAASYGQARQMAPLQVLDSADGNAPTYSTYLEMMKQPGRYIPANEGDKAIAKENLMQDIQGSSKIFRSDIAKMKADFPVDMQAKIALAMRADDPHAALSQIIGADALGSLSPDQQQVYVDLQQLAEQGMAVRSLLGAGQGSDTMRAAMRTTLPSLLGPKDLAIRQLNAFDATIARLHRGVNNVKLNETGQAGQPSKGKVSLAKAMSQPQFKGVPKAIVQQAIEKQGFEVIP